MILLLACTNEAELQARAMDPSTPLEEAVEACSSLDEGADECLAELVRGRSEAGPELCQRIEGARWRHECHFAMSERRSAAGDRWEALVECGLSGDFRDECQYHLWSRELQAIADRHVDGRALEGVAEAAEVVRWWSGLPTVAGDVEGLLWADWWYYAHSRNLPARIEDCALAPAFSRCEEGTLRFAERRVAEALLRDPQRRARACRAGKVPEELVGWVPEPRMDEAGALGLADVCEDPPRRPWNPVFLAGQPMGPQK